MVELVEEGQRGSRRPPAVRRRSPGPRGVDHDRGQPRVEPQLEDPRAVPLAERPVGPDERVLGGVLRLGRVAEEPQRDRVEPVLAGADERLEGRGRDRRRGRPGASRRPSPVHNTPGSRSGCIRRGPAAARASPAVARRRRRPSLRRPPGRAGAATSRPAGSIASISPVGWTRKIQMSHATWLTTSAPSGAPSGVEHAPVRAGRGRRAEQGEVAARHVDAAVGRGREGGARPAPEAAHERLLDEAAPEHLLGRPDDEGEPGGDLGARPERSGARRCRGCRRHRPGRSAARSGRRAANVR